MIALDRLEERLGASIDPLAAKAIVSDALLLAFGLRRERAEELEFSEIGSRRGTADEYRLLALLDAAERHADSAAEAAMAFDPANHRSLVGLAADLARRLKTAGFGLDGPPSPPPPPDDLQLGETVVVEGPWRAGRRTEH